MNFSRIDRIVLWDKLKAEYNAFLDAKVPNDITVTLPDGKEVNAQSWRTTPYEIAKGISQGLADNTVIAKVNNELWDLDRPLESNCKLELLKFDRSSGRPTSFLAFQCTHFRRSYGKNIRWLFMLWPADRKWILLRYVPRQQRHIKFGLSSFGKSL